MSGILWLGGISILLLFVFVLPILTGRSRGHGSDLTEAIHNLKQVNLALIDFDDAYGAFPDTSTISAVQAKTSTPLSLGSKSSNDMFRQLFAAGTASSEKIFWAKTEGTPKRGNNLLGANTLMKGECAFTYIAGLSTSSDASAPVVMTPVIPGTWKFDPKPFSGKAVILRADLSVRSEPIDKNGDVIIGGMNLFDPRQPYWSSKPPDIKWPE